MKKIPVFVFWFLYSLATNRTRRVWAKYRHGNAIHKLHVGCGDNVLKGWLNTDLFPSGYCTRLNAARRFPYPDNAFDYIFSEHMIEHISYGAGLIMLRECFRVLKPNGILRLVTPDMKFLISLFYEATSNQRYIEWASERFIKDNAPSCATSVINHFHHAWGHRYIYDGSVIKDALEKAGFSEITECQISKSDHPELSNLENIQRMPPGFLEMESIIFEAQKICR